MNKVREKWESPPCNLCGSKKQRVLYDKLTYWEYPGVFRVVQCDRCALVFTSPRPVLSEIGKYYVQKYYWGRDFQKKEHHDDKKEREDAYGHVYTILESLKKKGKVLDIGAGTGLLLSGLEERGWDVEGVELSAEAVSYAKKRYGITLKKGDFFDFSYKENAYDVIVLNGALEHLYNPKETLQRVHTLLKKGGYVLFTVPNVRSFGNSIFGRNWFPWQTPRHLYHFSGTTAQKMLQKVGFHHIVVRYDYWLQNHYILFQSLRYAGSPKFQKSKEGGLVSEEQLTTTAFSLKKEVGKIVGKIFAYTLAFIEPYVHKGEILIVYAKKT